MQLRNRVETYKKCAIDISLN